MAGPQQAYRRLPGKGVSTFQYVRLYQATDHVLQVLSTGYNENYRRFYFRDIAAITIQKTHLGKICNGVFGFLAAAFGLPAFDMTGAAAIYMWSIAGFFGVLLLGNMALGPTCACYLRTAVQTERLHSVSRIDAARRLIKRIRPRIEAVQGSLAREEIGARLHSPVPTSATAYAGEAPPVASPQSSELPPVATPENSTGPLG